MRSYQIQFGTRLRGFFRQLVDSTYINFRISIHENAVYEINTRLHNIKAFLVHTKLADWLGIIQRIKVVPKSDINVVGSYNRFIETERPYFIYVENPTALYHYTLNRPKTYLGHRRLKKYLNDPYLRGIVFMSKACESTFEKLLGETSADINKIQIYPLIKRNPYVDLDFIEKNKQNTINFLYIAQGIRFFSKGGLEVIEAFETLSKKHSDITLTIVTNIEILSESIKIRLERNNAVKILDFKLSLKQMNELYAGCDVLLQPTSDDSFGLTILEAMHSGLAIIGSKLYSIPEIVKDGINGFLVEPHYWFFYQNDLMPNPSVWNRRKQTIYSGTISVSLVQELQDKMLIFINNRQRLKEMKLNSLKIAQEPPFSEQYIATQWNTFIDKLVNGYKKDMV